MTHAIIITGEPSRRFGWVGPIAGGLRAAGRTLRRLIATMIRRRCEKRMMAALNALENHMLKDIGISRSEIPYLVQQGRRVADAGRHSRKAST